MKANEFVKKYGLDAVKGMMQKYPKSTHVTNDACVFINSSEYKKHAPWFADDVDRMVSFDDLKRLVESHELTEKVGGLDVCKKIMFQKRLRQPKATHVLQHHENKKLIQFFSTNQSKPNGSVMLDAIEQAIADVESCQ